MSVPWRDKAGIIHAWRWSIESLNNQENHHAGWYTARALCGASRRLRHGRDYKDRPYGADVNCMTCLVRQESDNT